MGLKKTLSVPIFKLNKSKLYHIQFLAKISKFQYKYVRFPFLRNKRDSKKLLLKKLMQIFFEESLLNFFFQICKLVKNYLKPKTSRICCL